jgi:hypothetical protein
VTPLALLLAAALAAITLGYLLACWAKPFTPCIACRISPGDHFCRHCRGTGLRLRLGWQAYNHLTRLYRDTTSGTSRGSGRGWRP